MKERGEQGVDGTEAGRDSVASLVGGSPVLKGAELK